MPAGLGYRRQRRPSHERLGAAVATRNGSQSAASANAGAAPGAGAAAGKPRPKNRPAKVLRELETGKLLTGKQLAKAAGALTSLEIGPQVRGYGRLAKQLHSERESEAQGLGALGTQLTGDVSNVYQGIAQAEQQSLATQQALANQLNQTSAGIAQQGQQDLTALQNTQTQGVADALTARGAPGGGTAQQELAAAVASQKAAQGANSQASQQFAAQQGSSYGNLAAMMAGATQMQGGEAARGIGGAVLGRIAKSNQEYGGDIREARAKEAEARSSRGASYVKNLLGLRGEEQKYQLGKLAVRGEKAKLRADREEAAKDRALRREENATSNSQWAKEFGLKRWEAAHPNAGSNEVAEKRQEIKQDVNEVKSLIATVVGAEGAPKDGQQLNALIGALNSKASANPTIVRKVAQRWFKRHQRAMTQGNRGKKGATKTPYAP